MWCQAPSAHPVPEPRQQHCVVSSQPVHYSSNQVRVHHFPYFGGILSSYMAIVLESECLMALISLRGVDFSGARMTHIENRGPISNQAVNQYINGDAYLSVHTNN